MKKQSTPKNRHKNATTSDASRFSEMQTRFSEMQTRKERIVHYLSTGSYLAGLSESEKRSVRAQAKCHTYDEARDELYYTGTKLNAKRKVVTTEDEVLRIIRFHHSDVGVHSGINTTLSKVSACYTWSRMKDDVIDFIKSCNCCQRSHKMKTESSELKRIKITEPLQLVGMNLVGPLPTTREGYNYVLTFTDYYSKFVEFFPLKSHESSDVAACIHTFVYRWGAPKRLFLDQGQEFVAKVNDDLCKKLGIARSITSTYHPQTSRLNERTNQMLRERIDKLVNDNKDDWADHLDALAFSIRKQKQTSTEPSPFFQMFGRRPRTVMQMDPAEDDVMLQPSDSEDNEAIEAVAKREQTTSATHTKVMESVASPEKELAFKQWQSKGTKTFQFSVGHFVLRHSCRNIGRKGGKMEPLGIGPYKNVYFLGRKNKTKNKSK